MLDKHKKDKSEKIRKFPENHCRKPGKLLCAVNNIDWKPFT